MIAIETNHLTKSFGGRKAVDDVTFTLPVGSFLSIFGPNGAGKTTLLRMLSTLTRPTEGTAQIAGIDLREHPEEVRSKLGIVSHSPMLYPDLTAEENLVFYGRLYGMSAADAQKRAIELLGSVGLRHRRMDRVRTFSRGMTQRTQVARALVNSPEIVMLDEPYSGLDPKAAESLDSLLCETRALNPNQTFVMISHDRDRGERLATHILEMDQGAATLTEVAK